MSGFNRQIQPPSPRREIIWDQASRFVRETEIALLLREQDPFQCDDPCPGHPVGHYAIWSAGDIVCAYCSKVFWG